MKGLLVTTTAAAAISALPFFASAPAQAQGATPVATAKVESPAQGRRFAARPIFIPGSIGDDYASYNPYTPEGRDRKHDYEVYNPPSP